MKKSTRPTTSKKLNLSKESIRLLSAKELQAAAGGGGTDCCYGDTCKTC